MGQASQDKRTKGVSRLSGDKTPAVVTIVLLLLAACSQKEAAKDASMFPAISDDSLLTLTEYQTFQYFWDGAEPVSGAARERIHIDGVYPAHDENIVTSGGTGFGIMAIIAATERGFITREQSVQRLTKLVDWLGHADRFHGAWPHWMVGETGKVKPFSPKDNGGDLVETSYLAQGLLCARQYFKDGTDAEKQLAAEIDALWKGIEWSWYRNGVQNVLYWHWSPEFGWQMNFPVRGYNECLILYVLAASSPTFGVPAEVYHEGWARSGDIINDSTRSQYGYHLSLKHNGAEQFGGPLFWEHYSFLGLDPRNLTDRYADYWNHNRNHVLINMTYCEKNPKNYAGYGEDCWGLTSSYSMIGYAGHSPTRDLGVISPTAAISSFPYTPGASMKALRHFHDDLGDRIWGIYGPYDAFSETEQWFPQRYLAIDQGPIVVMIENYRSGLLWKLFMSCPEVQSGLDKLGFTYNHE